MTRQGGLGRGLGALLPEGRSGDEYRIIDVDRVRPNPQQPRNSFDEATMTELAQSIEQVGLLQPILVRHIGEGSFQIVAGERRFRAAKRVGLSEIPVIVRQTDDTNLLTEALVENIHRSDLNPLEEAAAYRQLLDDFSMTHDELAVRVGKSRSAVTNSLRLLALSPAVQQKLTTGSLSAGHARTLLALEDHEQQQRVAQRVVGAGLSVRATEDLVRSLSDGASRLKDLADAAKKRAVSPYSEVQKRLTDALATNVRITGTDRRGRVVINYSGREDLERLLDIFGRGSGQNILP